jgi:hypothetical protein
MAEFKTLQSIVDQLQKCNYQTNDGLHQLELNAAFIALKQMAEVEAAADMHFQIHTGTKGTPLSISYSITPRKELDEQHIKRIANSLLAAIVKSIMSAPTKTQS